MSETVLEDSEMAQGEGGKALKPSEVAEINAPIVYALCDKNRGIFYVGRTRNPKRRMMAYVYPKYCHNPELKSYLINNPDFQVKILSVNPDNLAKTETFFIDKYYNQTFNKIIKDFGTTRSQPWSAGAGIRCPSAYLMWRASKLSGVSISDHPDLNSVKTMIQKMGKKERCLYETELYLTAKEPIKKNLDKWFSLCVNKMSKEVLNG